MDEKNPVNLPPLRVGGASLNQLPMDWIGNAQRIRSAIIEAKRCQINLLCFSELVITGYGCEDWFLAPYIAVRAWEQLQEMISETENITVCIGLPIQFKGNLYNGVAVVTDKKIQGVTLKQHLAKSGVHYEPRWFSAWEGGRTDALVFQGKSVPIGDLSYTVGGGKTFIVEICEDAWVEEEERPAARWKHRQHIDIILNASSSHFSFGKNKIRQDLIINSSRMFGVTYLYVNTLGNEAGRIIYEGDIIIAHQGKLILQNSLLSFAEINISSIDILYEVKENKALISNQLIKFEEFVKAESLALFDYLRKSKHKGFVISLSGGADSACCLILASEMIKRAIAEIGIETFCSRLQIPAEASIRELIERMVICTYQSTANSSEKTFASAQALARQVGAQFYQCSVEEETQAYIRKLEQVIKRPLNWQQDDTVMQNVQARARSPFPWMLANFHNFILLTTSNRSEGDMGYATMDGDMSGGLAPLVGVDKDFIRQWLLWAQNTLDYSELTHVNALEPTAELKPKEYGQADEKDLMPYKILVAIESLAIGEKRSPHEVYETLRHQYESEMLKSYLQKFYRKWAANQWKRERTAPSFHLDNFNIDPRSGFRFPILSAGFVEELNELKKNSDA